MNYDISKISTELEIAIDTPEDLRQNSLDLNVGYDMLFREWELIIKYTGNLDKIATQLEFTFTELLNGYAIIRISEEKIELLSQIPEIIFIEKPKSIYTADTSIQTGKIVSCMDINVEALLGTSDVALNGDGVLVAVIDSGIDFSNPYFINPDGTSKIVSYWNQDVPGNPPEGYKIGSVYSGEELKSIDRTDSIFYDLTDVSGHGTAVAGIIAESVPMAGLIIVKLADSNNFGFPRTTSLMMGIDYSIRVALNLNLPLVINISFGNNYGDHAGNSILESYINDVSGVGRINMVTGMGNDGNSGRHIRRLLKTGQSTDAEFIVRLYETAINIQIWRSYADDVLISMTTPRNEIIGPFNKYQEIMTYNLADMTIIVLNGSPSPINKNQETYISIIPNQTYIQEGIWKISIQAKKINDGFIDLWLPVADSTSTAVSFLESDADISLTIPASASSTISVGAYDAVSLTYAPFSGRGFTRDNRVKPEISAPGVGIKTAAIGGGETIVSGTSFAAPFVSAGAAMLMQWGITTGNDPYLYAEKLKAYLIRGARKLPGYMEWPNEKLGYGALCVKDSLPI